MGSIWKVFELNKMVRGAQFLFGLKLESIMIYELDFVEHVSCEKI